MLWVAMACEATHTLPHLDQSVLEAQFNIMCYLANLPKVEAPQSCMV